MGGFCMFGGWGMIWRYSSRYSGTWSQFVLKKKKTGGIPYTHILVIFSLLTTFLFPSLVSFQRGWDLNIEQQHRFHHFREHRPADVVQMSSRSCVKYTVILHLLSEKQVRDSPIASDIENDDRWVEVPFGLHIVMYSFTKNWKLCKFVDINAEVLKTWFSNTT